MSELFCAISERLKVIFTAHAALELEAELILSHIERRANLLRSAAKLEEEGFTDLANDLRRHAGEMDTNRPADKVLTVLPALSNCNGHEAEGHTPTTPPAGTAATTSPVETASPPAAPPASSLEGQSPPPPGPNRKKRR
jgi:hypothetical protein